MASAGEPPLKAVDMPPEASPSGSGARPGAPSAASLPGTPGPRQQDAGGSRDGEKQAARSASVQRWRVVLALAHVAAELTVTGLRQAAGFYRRTRGKWARTRVGKPVRGVLALEALLIPWIALAIAISTRPDDPLCLGAEFPWTWLGVWLVALRYGTLWAAPGVLALALVWGFTGHWNLAGWPHVYFLGGTLTTMVIGEFASMWRLRAKAESDIRQELENRLAVLVRRLYLLKLSHDELETEIVSRPSTLRDALRDLRATMALVTRHADDPVRALSGARPLLNFLETHCTLLCAGIYRVRQSAGLRFEEVAVLGKMTAPSVEDPIFIEALRWDRLVHRQFETIDDSNSELLAACVLRDETGDPCALLAVREMPLTAVTEENMRKLAALFESYGDYLRDRARLNRLQTDFPRLPLDLLAECESWIRIFQRHGDASHLVVWRAGGGEAAEREKALSVLLQRHLVSANAWAFPPGAQSRPRHVVVVLGITDAGALRLYTQRLLGEVAQQAGADVAGLLRHSAHPLDGTGVFAWLERELESEACT